MNDLIPIGDLQTMAVAIAKSGLFGAKTPDQALALMLVAQAEGLHPASAARDYDIIQGKGAKKSEAMLRDFLKSGGTVKWRALDNTQADATFSHPAGGEVRISWDMKRATAAGLASKEMYTKFPRQMLRARCVSEGVRTVCPMATGGMYTLEEVQDIEPTEKVIGSGSAIIAQPRSKSDQRGAPEDSHMSAQAGRAEAPIGNQHEAPAQTAPHPKTSAAQENGPNGADAIPKSEPASAAGPDIDPDGPVLQPQQVKILLKRMESAALTDLDIKAKFGKPLGALKAAQFNAIVDWMKNPAA